MISPDFWGVEWLVATLSPWAVSPHPNFPGDRVCEASKLALVTEMRRPGEAEGERLHESSTSGWEDILVASAQGSLRADTQEESAAQLLELAGTPDLLPGVRAAAALFGSVALCELERHSEAVDALTELSAELRDGGALPFKYTASQRLIIASICMQLSTRLTEICRFEEARDRVEQTLEWLPKLKDAKLQHFEVSEGISWGSSTVQRDLVRSVTNHATALKSYLEGFGGETWVRVVRSRTSWVDMRMHLRSADRDEIVLRDAYERRIEADSKTRHFGRITVDTAGYRSLTLAELSGHLGFMRDEREKLGKVLILERGEDPERVREALRLLRQGRATKALQAAITWIRAQGPSTSLREDALAVTRRVNSAKWCTEQDLLILEGAADLLSPKEKDLAISAAFVFAETPQFQQQIDWSSWERLWKTVSRLVPSSSRHNDVASRAYTYTVSQGSLSQPTTNTLARLVSCVDWREVSPELVRQWSDLSESIRRDFETSGLLDAIDKSVRGLVSPVPTDVGIERAAYLADVGLLDDEGGGAISEHSIYLGALLRAEVEAASKGVMSLGGYQSANVAVAFALRFPSEDLWEDIVLHLLDPRVDAGLKDLAVGRLAENVTVIPSAVAAKLRESIHLLVASERREGMFTSSRSQVFGEAIQLSAALDAISRSDLLETVLRLAAAGVGDRIQAAKIVPFGLAKTDAIWGHVLLLQLSHDRDPSVRAAAGHALVRSLSMPSAITDVVHSRIVELLNGDGIKVPLAILHSVQRNSRLAGSQLESLVGPIEALASAERSDIIQGAARICLKMLSEPK